MPNLSPHGLLNQLQQLLGTIEKDKDVKKQACAIARKLWLELEDPGDLANRMICQPEEKAILYVAMDLGIYHYLVQAGSPVSSEDLAKAKGTDLLLMERVLRNLAALGHIEEIDASVYCANKFSQVFTTTKGISGIQCVRDLTNAAWFAIPSFLKATACQNPTDLLNAPLQQGFNTDNHFFNILAEHNFLDTFQTYMSNYRTDRAEFLDVFPAEKRLLQNAGCGNNDVLMVDVGGGQGHEIQKFVQKFPEKKGRMILQEQPNVLSKVPQSDAMEVIEYDFFTPQPVHGARAYYFRMIFHDWPDNQCLLIFQNTVQAMKPGYSKLLINDIVLPNKGAGAFATQSDITMMCLLAAMERSEAQWRALLERAGLKNIRIWAGDPESVIEAEV